MVSVTDIIVYIKETEEALSRCRQLLASERDLTKRLSNTLSLYEKNEKISYDRGDYTGQSESERLDRDGSPRVCCGVRR